MERTVEDYQGRVGRLDLSGVAFDVFRWEPLPAGDLRCVRYMHDVEFHTACYLRDLLVTRAHRDPDVTTFLTLWAYEEYWHGDALARVLAAHGEEAAGSRVGRTRERLGWRDAFRPLASLAGSLVTADFVAVHMAWGAVNEWTTQAGYARLSARAQHPVLSELLRRIMRQEGRHIDFYSTQARARLEASSRARTVTRVALSRLWKPVGSGVMPRAETEHLVSHLFDGAEGLAVAGRIDRRVDRLPGLAGLGLVAGAVSRWGTC